jgi:large subunit ribosomal protein L21
MQAVIQTGGKQVMVAEGDVIFVELLRAAKGADVRFEDVRLLTDGASVKVGKPTVGGAAVTATVLDEVKGPKTRAVFFRKRKDSMTTKGHRQRYHKVKITGIQG